MMRYTSSVHLFGVPLVDVQFGDGRQRRRASGWIAVGDVAVGVLFAAGGFAAGTFAIGGVAIAAVPFGGLTLGLFAIGGLAIGIWSVGGAAVAVHTAVGGLAVAGHFAFGGAAFGPHTHGPIARPFIGSIVRSALAQSALGGTIGLLMVAFVVLALVVLLRSRRA